MKDDGLGRNSLGGPDAFAGPRVLPGSHLTLHYRLSLADGAGDVISTFGGKPASFQLGLGQLAEPLEAKLLGLREGESRRFEFAAGEAFGQWNAGLVKALARAAFDASVDDASDYRPGDFVDLPRPDGGRYAGVLRSIDPQRVVFDFNHPLAGRALVFEVSVLGIL